MELVRESEPEVQALPHVSPLRKVLPLQEQTSSLSLDSPLTARTPARIGASPTQRSLSRSRDASPLVLPSVPTHEPRSSFTSSSSSLAAARLELAPPSPLSVNSPRRGSLPSLQQQASPTTLAAPSHPAFEVSSLASSVRTARSDSKSTIGCGEADEEESLEELEDESDEMEEMAEVHSGSGSSRMSEESLISALHRRSVSPGSQHSSRASSPSFNHTPPADLHGGDPVGEALAAGMGFGAGAPRASSRRSSATQANALTLVPTPPSPPALASPPLQPLLPRRGSTKSDSGRSFVLHSSPPPRYSEESTRSWASVAFPPPLGLESETTTPVSPHPPTRRRRSASSDNSNRFMIGPPAYADGSESFMSAAEKKGQSTSSLMALSEASASTGPRPAARLSRGVGEAAASSTSTANMHPAHELQMLQHSIDRLYEAAPQMHDQRVTLPDPTRRASQREQDMVQMVERLTKVGRLDDQRAAAPTSRLSMDSTGERASNTGIGNSPSGESQASSTPARSRRFPSVGSISLGSLSVRRASQLLDMNPLRLVKGKDRDTEPEAGAETSVDAVELGRQAADDDELDAVAAQLQAASMRGMHDQRAPAPSVQSSGGVSQQPLSDMVNLPPRQRRTNKSKLAAMGIDTSQQNGDDLDGDDNDEGDDDELFDVMDQMKPRMTNQDAVLRSPAVAFSPSTVRAARVPRAGSPRSSILDAPSLSSSTATEVQGNATHLSGAATPPALPASLPAGESTLVVVGKGQEETAAADAQHFDVCRNSLSPFCFFAETQDRLGVVSASVWLDEQHGNPKGSDTMSYELHDEERHSILSVQSGDAKGQFRLPCRVVDERNATQKSERLSLQRECWSLRLSIQPAVKVGDDAATSAHAPLSAPLLALHKPSSWQCRSCHVAISKAHGAVKYVALPSQHWEELVDAWMCHTDQVLSDNLVQAQKNLEQHTGLELGQVHVSDSQIVVPHSMLLEDRVTTGHAAHQRVACRQCNATLGHWSERGAVKLLKLAILPCDAHGEVLTELELPVSAFIAQDLIRCAHVHATRHFCISSDEEGDDDESGRAAKPQPMSLWLFLDRFDVALSPASESLHALPRFPAAKVMFRQASTAMTTMQEPSWTHATAVDHLTYPADSCRSLRTALEASNAAYPPSQRSFVSGLFANLDGGGTEPWRCGFLPL